MLKELGLVALIPALLNLACSTQDPFSDYSSGEAAEVRGVLHIPATSSGDFLPRKLRVIQDLQAGSVNWANLLNTLSPGATMTLVGTIPPNPPIGTQAESQEVQVTTPAGTSLQTLGNLLLQVPSFTSVTPYYKNDSHKVAIKDPSFVGPSYLADTLVLVHTTSPEAMSSIDKVSVSQFRVRLPNGERDLTPSQEVQILDFEAVDPRRIQAEGLVRRLGDARDCILLETDDGDLWELVGTGILPLVSEVRPDQTRIRVSLKDRGVRLDSCSGGLTGELDSFQILG